MRRKLAFWKGVRLWQHCQSFPAPNDTSNAGRATGVTRRFGALGLSSDNRFLDLQVPCAIRPPENVDQYSDDQDAHVVEMHTCVANLIAASDPSDLLGDLSWCPDSRNVVNVTGGPYPAGSNVTIAHDAVPATMTMRVGMLLLLRKPGGVPDVGFCGEVTAVGASDVTIKTTDMEVDIQWEMIEATMYYPDTKYERCAFAPPNIGAGDRHKTGIGATYYFTGAAFPVVSADAQRDVS